MKLLDYSGLQRFLAKIKTLLDSKANAQHTHSTSDVTDLLSDQHTWSSQQSYNADLNLNYSSTDVDDIIDTLAGSYTAEDFLAQNNVWTGDNTFTANVSLQGGIYAQNYYLGTTAFGDIVTHNASEFSVSGHTHTASEVSGLATVATSGSYNDLSNKPTIDSALSSTSTNAVQNKVINTALAGKAASSHTHTKSQITDFPTKTSQFTNDSHQTITVGTDTTSTASPAHSETFTCIDSVTRDSNGHVTAVNTKTVTLPADNNTDTKVTQNVSTANENHPILLTVTKDATNNQGAKTSIFASGVKVNPSTNTVTATTFSGALSGNASSATQFSANKSVTLTGDVTGTASSKAGWSVATTLSDSGVTAGTYGPSADVTGNNNATISVPEITVDSKGRVTSVANRTLTCKNNTYNVYNKTLTIQKNGTNVATFTSNSNTDVTANITVPTKTSELTNDSGFLTSHQSLSNYVTLNSAQTISATKTWTKSQSFKNTAITNHKENPTTDTEIWACQFWSNDNKYWGGLGHKYLTTGFSEVQLCMSNWTTSGSQGYWHLDFGAAKDFSSVYFRPSGNNNIYLGTSDKKWANVYATTFTGDLTGNVTGNVTGNCSGSSGSCSGNSATASKVVATVANDNTGALVQGTMGTNDCFRIAIGGASNAGWAEIATGDDYNEPIYVRQYQGSFTTLKRTATLLDASGNTSFPGTVTATGFSGPLTGNVTGNCSGSSGSCTGNAANVTGTVAIAHGGTGATTRLGAVKALTDENVGTGSQYFITITTNWGKAGYCSVADAKAVLGLGTAAYTASTAYAAASHTHSQYLTAHQSLDSCVKTSGDQDIAGDKRFTSAGVTLKNSGFTVGTAPSLNRYWTYFFADSANAGCGRILKYVNKDGSSGIEIQDWKYNNTSTTVTLKVGFDSSGNAYSSSSTTFSAPCLKASTNNASNGIKIGTYTIYVG